MSRASLVLIFLGLLALGHAALEDGVKVDVQFMPDTCETKAENGHYVGVHYVGMLTDGTEFDNSYTRGEEIEFQLGAGQVIAGWEEGILGMCLNEKRKLTIPPHLGYGEDGIGPIPGGATLLFDVELVSVSDVPTQGGQGGEDDGYEVYQSFGDEGEEGEEESMQFNFGEEGEAEWS